MSDPVFNPELPYGTVTGLPGVRYQQNGHSFTASGEYVTPEQEKAMSKPSRQEIEIEKAARKAALKEAFKEELAKGQPVQVITAKKSVDFDPKVIDIAKSESPEADLSDTHWTKLRKMVEEKGGKYTGKDEAIRFLSTGS